MYSLGVTLYQALTGRFPYSVTGPLPEVIEHIRHQEPARPSSINPKLDDEIDTIVLKSLAKDQKRRYQGAGEFARDLDRYLRNEPIEAKRASGLYVLKKTLGRHKVVDFFIRMLILSLSALAAVMTIQSVRLSYARDAANRAQITAETREIGQRQVRQPSAPNVSTG